MQDENEYRPRAHDHLVEPMFGALGGASDERPPVPGPEPQARRAPGALRRWLGLWVPREERDADS